MNPIRSHCLHNTLRASSRLPPQARLFSKTLPLPITYLIKNVSFTTTETLLREALQANGVPVRSLTLVGHTKNKSGRFWSKGYAFLETPDEEVEKDLQGLKVEGKELQFSRSESKPYVKKDEDQLKRDEEEGWGPGWQ